MVWKLILKWLGFALIEILSESFNTGVIEAILIEFRGYRDLKKMIKIDKNILNDLVYFLKPWTNRITWLDSYLISIFNLCNPISVKNEIYDKTFMIYTFMTRQTYNNVFYLNLQIFSYLC